MSPNKDETGLSLPCNNVIVNLALKFTRKLIYTILVILMIFSVYLYSTNFFSISLLNGLLYCVSIGSNKPCIFNVHNFL